MWALSNIAAGPPYMLDSVLNDHTLDEICKIAEDCGWQDVKAEALFTVTNMVTNATESQFRQMLMSKEILSLLVGVIRKGVS